MTKQTAQQHLQGLVQALADGKQIQIQSWGKWFDATDLSLALASDCYRIKPEPIKQEFYYVLCKETGVSPYGACFYTYGGLDQVKNYVKQFDPNGEKYVIMHANAKSIEGV